MTDIRRERRILYSYATTGFSKIAAAGVQLIGLPLVALSLGSERFGAMLVLAAIGSFCLIPIQGLPSAVSFGIARARGLKDDDQLARNFWSSGFLASVLGLFALPLIIFAYFAIDPVWLIGPDARSFSDEATYGIAALGGQILMTYLFGWAEGVRQAYEEYHISNLFTMTASFLALLGIGLSWFLAPSIPTFFFAMYVVYPLMHGVSLLAVFLRRRNELGSFTFDINTIKETMNRSIGYSIAQIGLIFHLHGSVFLAAHGLGLHAGAVVGGMIRLFYIAHNFLLSLLNPLFPTLSHAVAVGDVAWIKRVTRYVTYVSSGLLLMFSIMIMVSGDQLLGIWLHLEAGKGPVLFFAFGIMAFFYISAQLFYLTLLSLGHGEWPSRMILGAGLVGFCAGFLAMRGFGLTGLIVGQATVMLLLGYLPVGARLYRHIHHQIPRTFPDL